MTMPPNSPLGRDRDSRLPNPPVRKTENWIKEHWIIVAIVVAVVVVGLFMLIGHPLPGSGHGAA